MEDLLVDPKLKAMAAAITESNSTTRIMSIGKTILMSSCKILGNASDLGAWFATSFRIFVLVDGTI